MWRVNSRLRIANFRSTGHPSRRLDDPELAPARAFRKPREFRNDICRNCSRAPATILPTMFPSEDCNEPGPISNPHLFNLATLRA
jgi:hypothetical protein